MRFIIYVFVFLILLPFVSCDKSTLDIPEYEEMYTEIPAPTGEGHPVVFHFEYNEIYSPMHLPDLNDYIFHVYKKTSKIVSEPDYNTEHSQYEEFFVAPYKNMTYPLLLDPGEYKFFIKSRRGYSLPDFPYMTYWGGNSYAKIDSTFKKVHVKFLIHEMWNIHF